MRQRFEGEGPLVCLEARLIALGHAVPREALQVAWYRLHGADAANGVDLAGLQVVARALGLEADWFAVAFDDLEDDDLPCIVPLDGGQWVLLRHRCDNGVHAFDPAVGEIELDLAELAQRWPGVIFVSTSSGDVDDRLAAVTHEHHWQRQQQLLDEYHATFIANTRSSFIYRGIGPDSSEVCVKRLPFYHRADSFPARAFQRELKVVERLRAAPHPCVIGIQSIHEDAGCYVMPFFAGRALDQLELPVEWPRVARILDLIAAGLGHLHGLGVVHRDLSAANVLVAGDDVRLIDFGLSLCDSDEPADPTAGTPHFRAPEQYRGGGAVSQATDLFCLGLLGFRLVTGRHPFEAAVVPPYSESPYPDDDDAFDAAIARAPVAARRFFAACLRLEPARRASLAEVRGVLGSNATGAGR